MTSPSTVPLSVVVVNTSHRDLLRQCLTALSGARLPAGTEIIVVDNASTDGSAAMVESEFPHVRLTRQAHRHGPAASYNAGFAISRGEHLVVLNEDAEVTEDALWRLYTHLQGNPSVAVAAPRLVYPDGTPQQCCNRFPGFSSAFKRLILQAVFRGPWVDNTYREEMQGQSFEPDWIMATSLMIRRAALNQVGPYDERFVVYYEEIDLCRRLRARGWRIAWIAEALVKHHHGVSNLKLRNDRDIDFRLILYQSRYRYFEKHHGRLFTGLLRLVEGSLFFLFTLKTKAESAVPQRRDLAARKTRLYGSLLRYALSGQGCPELPQ